MNLPHACCNTGEAIATNEEQNQMSISLSSAQIGYRGSGNYPAGMHSHLLEMDMWAQAVTSIQYPQTQLCTRTFHSISDICTSPQVHIFHSNMKYKSINQSKVPTHEVLDIISEYHCLQPLRLRQTNTAWWWGAYKLEEGHLWSNSTSYMW